MALRREKKKKIIIFVTEPANEMTLVYDYDLSRT